MEKRRELTPKLTNKVTIHSREEQHSLVGLLLISAKAFFLLKTF